MHELVLQKQTKDAKFAATYGIVDEIRDAKIPAGVPIIPLDSAAAPDSIAASNVSALRRILG